MGVLGVHQARLAPQPRDRRGDAEVEFVPRLVAVEARIALGVEALGHFEDGGEEELAAELAVGDDRQPDLLLQPHHLRDGAVLLQNRADTGGWGLPGGAVELGETAHQAAVRETFEETGVHIEVTRLVGVYTGYEMHYPNGDVTQPIVIAFQAVPLGSGEPGAVHAGETLEARWVGLEEAPPLFNQQNRDVLADVLAGRAGVYR